MATITNYGQGQTNKLKDRKPMPPDPSCQPCPDCGALECLCRPRFFAGQLLSEQDLNRLDRYIVEKNKLHNRHLFGSGVVCGLEVRCAPCDSGFVSVAPGYALSPCGEDIVVCKQDLVDICALIARCRNDGEPDCAPYRGQESCGDVVEEWILSIRYAESPSRGITALTGAGQGCGCSCAGPCSGKCGGGSCGCGGGASCSCGAATGQVDPEPLRQPRLNRGAPPSCEPTLTCETYRYDVFRALQEETKDRIGERGGIAGILSLFGGDMFARIACCIQELQAAIPEPPGDISAAIADADKGKWFAWACRVRTAIANYFVRAGSHDCQAIAKLQAVVIPSASQPAVAFTAAMGQAYLQMSHLLFEAMFACFCSNALPPCPAPGDPRIPLASVKVRRGDCTVISVCNWTPLRKHVLTFPTLEYWFGWIPIERLLRTGMEDICCNLFGLRSPFVGEAPQEEVPQAPPPVPAAKAAPQEAAAAPQGFEKGAPGLDDTVSLDTMAGADMRIGLLQAVMLRHQMDPGGLPTLGDIARATLERPTFDLSATPGDEASQAALRRAAASPAIGLMTEMARTAVQPALTLADVLRGAGPAAAAPMHPEVAELRTLVERHQEEIAALKTRIESDGNAPAPAPTSPRSKSRAAGRGRNK